MSQYLNSIKIQYYYLEQYINQLILYDLNRGAFFFFILIFISGTLSSINPCTLSILPVAISYTNPDSTIKNIYKQNIFIAGITTSFLLTIIFTSLINQYCQVLIYNIPIIYSLFMICLGLSLLDIIKINLAPLITNKISVSISTFTDIIKDYLTGFVIGLNSSSCSTPILVAITFWTSQAKYNYLEIEYIICYVLGYILPIIILVQVTTNYIKSIHVKNIWEYFTPISGSIILCLGALSLFHNTFI